MEIVATFLWRKNGLILLCKSVLGSLGVYFFSVYKAPEKVLNQLESLRSKFFWNRNNDTRSITWITWKDVLADEKRGGLGINSLKAQNLSLLGKWWWRFKNEQTNLWKIVISGIHGASGGLPSTNANNQQRIGGVWGAIIKICKPLAKVNIDLPSLFSHCSLTVNGVTTNKWSWILEPSGQFSLASLRTVIDNSLHCNTVGFITRWCHLVPSKINILAWRIQHSRLATKVNIEHRDIDIGSCLCPFCEKDVETEEPLFLKCDFARLVLRAIWNWWGITYTDDLTIALIFEEEVIGFSGKLSHYLRAVCFVYFWTLWNARNSLIFENKKASWTVIADQNQSLSLFWFNSRCNKKMKKLNWINWCCDPKYEILC